MSKFVNVLVIIVVAFVVLGPLWALSINVFGIPQTVTVSFHKKMQSGNPGSSYKIVSCGYYYVKGKQYSAYINKDVPIGTRFDIKYDRILHSQFNAIRILQE